MEAARLNTEFNWKLEIVADVGHDVTVVVNGSKSRHAAARPLR